MENYYTVWKAREEVYLRTPFKETVPLPNLDNFGKFDDVNGYHGVIPSEEFLKKHYVSYSAQSYNLKNQFLQTLTGEILKGDHTFKVAKIPTEDGVRPFVAMYSVMNEYQMVLTYQMVPSKCLEDLRSSLEEVFIPLHYLNDRFGND